MVEYANKESKTTNYQVNEETNPTKSKSAVVIAKTGHAKDDSLVEEIRSNKEKKSSRRNGVDNSTSNFASASAEEDSTLLYTIEVEISKKSDKLGNCMEETKEQAAADLIKDSSKVDKRLIIEV